MCLLERGYRYFVCIFTYNNVTTWSIDEIRPNNKAVAITVKDDSTKGFIWMYPDDCKYPKFKTKKGAVKFLFLSGVDITQ